MICHHCQASWSDTDPHCPQCGKHATDPHPVAVVITPRGPRLCCTTTELDALMAEAERRGWVTEEYWSPAYAATQLGGPVETADCA